MPSLTTTQVKQLQRDAWSLQRTADDPATENPWLLDRVQDRLLTAVWVFGDKALLEIQAAAREMDSEAPYVQF
jgi:hypothetical protein